MVEEANEQIRPDSTKGPHSAEGSTFRLPRRHDSAFHTYFYMGDRATWTSQNVPRMIGEMCLTKEYNVMSITTRGLQKLFTVRHVPGIYRSSRAPAKIRCCTHYFVSTYNTVEWTRFLLPAMMGYIAWSIVPAPNVCEIVSPSHCVPHLADTNVKGQAQSQIPTAEGTTRISRVKAQQLSIKTPMVLGKAAFLGMLTLTPGAAIETESPNEPIPKPECDASIPVSIRYSSTSSRLYLESVDGSTRGGCVTLPQIWEHKKGTVPVYAVDPQSGDISDNSTGTWLLTEDLFVEDGITLQVRHPVLDLTERQGQAYSGKHVASVALVKTNH